jgi:GT2 family glycosyltransferase
MGSPLVTVAIVPRERFSLAKQSLDNILATTTGDYELLYVDGNSPPDVRDYVACLAELHSFRVLRRERYLSPNQARNLAVQHVRTKYVVFIDNDVLVSPGWLEALVDCAEKTGAWVVGPIYCERLPVATWVHMAGGDCRIVERDGHRVFEEDHRHYARPLAETRPQLRREPTEQIEFHCTLVRRDVFDRLGPLDEQLWSAAEHSDLCLMVREAGGQVYVEPDSVITYVAPPPFTKADRDYFMLRWSHAWNTATIEHFRAKWRLEADDPGLAFLEGWCAKHRRIAWSGLGRAARWLGATPARWLQKRVLDPLEGAINRRRYPHVLSYLADARPRKATPRASTHAKQPYAQTNLQLYNQLLAAGRTSDDLRLIRDAYELALRLFAAQFRASGKPFVAHLVGVASVLAAHERPIETVVAGLLHSVYALGEFGDGSRGMTARKRHQVRLAVGDAAESLVARYAETSWDLATLAMLEDRAAMLTPHERAAIEIKLADVIDDHLDRSMDYVPAKKLAKDTDPRQWTEAVARLARAAGEGELAAELSSLSAASGGRVPDCLLHSRTASFVVGPPSYRERIASFVGRRFSRGHRAERRWA